MGVLTKRADQLKPGDMFIIAGRTAIVRKIDVDESTTAVFVEGISEPTYIASSTLLDVPAPDLTPVQQHADELLAFVEAAADSPARTALLDKITPPAAPTVPEMLGVLVGVLDPGVTAAQVKQRIEALVAKARRAGLVK